MKIKKGKNSIKGYGLVESIVAIGIIAVFLIVFMSSFYFISFQKYIRNKSLAFNLAHEEIEALRKVSFTELTNRTDARFINVAYNLGNWSISSSPQALSSPNVYDLAKPSTVVSGVTGLAVIPGDDYDDFTLEANIKALADSDNSWQAGLVFRYQDIDNFYRVRLATNDLIFNKIVNGASTILYSKSQVFSKDVWYKLKIEASGSSFNVYLDDNLLTATPVSDSAFTKGRLGPVGLNSVHAHFDDVKVTTSQTTIWNFDSGETAGEIATGWQRFGINDLPSGTDKLTIENAEASYDDLKKVTAKVEWKEQDKTKSVNLVTYISE